MKEALDSTLVLALAAVLVAAALWAAVHFMPSRKCRPLTPPESLYMPHGSTTCDLPVAPLSSKQSK